MTTLDKLSSFLNTELDIDDIKDFCPNGLQVEGKSSVKKIAFAVSASLETIEIAVEENVDALIVHHGIFWDKDPMPIVGTKKKKIELLLKNKISLLGYHLPLDSHQKVGNNFHAAKELGFSNLKPFGPNDIGVQGTFNPINIQAFQKSLENYYNHPAHTALGGKKEVHSAALISGGAHREIMNAVKAGVDCFITGSFDEPIWHIAFEEKINFFAMGHSNTETVGPKALMQLVKKKFSIDALFIDVPNPF